MLNTSFSDWINSFLACMGGCLGIIANSAKYLSICYPSGDVHCHGQLPDSSSVSDGFKAIDVDLRAARTPSPSSSILSQSLLSTNHNGPKTTTSSGGDAPEFVNNGLIQWNQVHSHWTVEKKLVNNDSKQIRDYRIGLSATYNSLLGNNKPFRRPIPLSEMVSFLVDVWVEEGLYGC